MFFPSPSRGALRHFPSLFPRAHARRDQYSCARGGKTEEERREGGQYSPQEEDPRLRRWFFSFLSSTKERTSLRSHSAPRAIAGGVRGEGAVELACARSRRGEGGGDARKGQGVERRALGGRGERKVKNSWLEKKTRFFLSFSQRISHSFSFFLLSLPLALLRLEEREGCFTLPDRNEPLPLLP